MMRATFTLAARYRVRAQCAAPLRTGNADADPESVLWDSQGRALLQGSSIAGALRSYLTARETPEIVEGLFGSAPPSEENQGGPKRAGRLSVSDGVFDAGAIPVVRPRLKIDGQSGSAKDGAKFDMAHMPTDSAFEFTLTWLGSEERKGELETVESMLTALHQGEIRLGAQKTNGFGQVRLLTVKKWKYQLSKAADRDAWLEGRANDETLLTLSDSDSVPRQDVIFRVRGRFDSLLVKGGVKLEKAAKSEQSDQEASRSYTAHLRENDAPVLPGSSVKGAVRARAEMIASYLKPHESLTRELFGYAPEDDTGGVPGKVIFEDVTFPEAANGNQVRKIRRIRINRFTAGVIQQSGPFAEETVSGAAELRIRVPSDCGAGCALILYALRDLGLGLYNLGSGGAVGRGRLLTQSVTAEAPGHSPMELTFDKNGVRSVSDPDGLFARWREAWEAYV